MPQGTPHSPSVGAELWLAATCISSCFGCSRTASHHVPSLPWFWASWDWRADSGRAVMQQDCKGAVPQQPETIPLLLWECSACSLQDTTACRPSRNRDKNQRCLETQGESHKFKGKQNPGPQLWFDIFVFLCRICLNSCGKYKLSRLASADTLRKVLPY